MGGDNRRPLFNKKGIGENMPKCADSQTQVCKAYISDCYWHIAAAFKACPNAEKPILKNNVFDMFDRIKTLLDEEPKSDIESD